MLSELFRMSVFSRLLLVLFLAGGCGGRATDREDIGGQGEASGGEASGGNTGSTSSGGAGNESGGVGNVAGSGGEGGAILPADCPSWETSYHLCQTCGGQYVSRFGRFPNLLADYLLVDSYEGYCPPSEAIDFDAFGETPPLYHREYHIVEWEPGVRECFYFVAGDENAARQCE